MRTKKNTFFTLWFSTVKAISFRVCPDDDFIITLISKKKAVKKTYPNKKVFLI
ncbi:MAG: hypothetical protein IIU11_10395 [Bacteroidales bacterium]|nr:hypothetical protein [Bacteroidales bacterium]MBR6278717.1 hypothetical protein [Bacteroidales bacterium]